jgi:hypothetical protein
LPGGAAGPPPGLFGHVGNAAAAARKPFKAPRVADSPGLSFCEGAQGEAGAGSVAFGAFGTFACAGAGLDGLRKVSDVQGRAAKRALL